MNIYQIDSFSDRPFAGNPAAVCVLPGPADPVWMQAVAAEMNLSETAFVCRRQDGDFDLRWFTPTVEVDLCGHATLASAHVLWTSGQVGEDEPIRFRTASGDLGATRRDGWIELDFPADPPGACDAPAGLSEAIGAAPVFAGAGRVGHLVELDSDAAVRGLRPDVRALERVTGHLIVTAPSDDPAFDFVSRYFAPASGIDEDPVTGSAHCCLGPYWRRRLGRDSFTAFQASTRGGVVKVVVAGDRVRLGGQAVTVLRGELLHDAARC